MCGHNQSCRERCKPSTTKWSVRLVRRPWQDCWRQGSSAVTAEGFSHWHMRLACVSVTKIISPSTAEDPNVKTPPGLGLRGAADLGVRRRSWLIIGVYRTGWHNLRRVWNFRLRLIRLIETLNWSPLDYIELFNMWHRNKIHQNHIYLILYA